MKKKNLLTIGELSKITGAHIKALRYYDSLNILQPEYVDPDTGYRYYTFQQKAVVEAIQFCVDIGVPLKEFGAYANEENASIFYNDLVRQGTTTMENRIRQMQERLERLKAMQAEINRAETCFQKGVPDFYDLPARNCWLCPYVGKLLSEKAKEVSKKVILEISHHGLRLGNTYGLLLMRQGNEWTQFLFVDVQNTGSEKYPQILSIPAGKYLCKTVGQSGIEQAWDWSRPFLEENQIRLILETELFVGNYNFLDPVLEQRCLMKDK